MPHSRSSSDLTGRILAFVVFAVGVGMLAFVFVTALRLFNAPVAGLALPVKPNVAPPPAANIGLALTSLLRQLLLLLLMTVAGSLIAKQGVHLYFGANGWRETETPVGPATRQNRAPSKSDAMPETASGESGAAESSKTDSSPSSPAAKVRES